MPKFKGWIVKLGGSLARSPALLAWLARLEQLRTPCVVVPGGGEFTTATRTLQRHWDFGDAAAHRMAILGMSQYGLMLRALAPGLGAAHSLQALETDPGAGARLWLPALDDVERMDALPADWRVSADSIALWLAGVLGAEGVALVKSVDVPAGEWHRGDAPGLADMARLGWIDTHFPVLHAQVPCRLAFYPAEATIPTDFPPA